MSTDVQLVARCTLPRSLRAENPLAMESMGNFATEPYPSRRTQVPTVTFIAEAPEKTLMTPISQVRILPPLPVSERT